MLLYARIFVLCSSLARIQKLQPGTSTFESKEIDQNVMGLWQSLVTTIMAQMAFLIGEPAYRCQLPWAPTYPALTIAFVSMLTITDDGIGDLESFIDNFHSYLCTSHRTLEAYAD